MDKKAYTKESIRARMLGRVAALWDMRNIDMLDPVVKLLVEALASEIYMLSGELEDTADRIVEKLASAFTPAWMLAASPAHAIVHARSGEPSVEIGTDTKFVYKDPHFLRQHDLRKLLFTPVVRTTLVNGDVASLITRGRIDEMSSRGEREPLVRNRSRSIAFNHSVWAGLDIAEEAGSLKNIAFYFDFPLMDSCEEYLKLMAYSKWSAGGQALGITPGIRESYSEERIFGLIDHQSRLYGDIIGKYNLHFITVDDEINAGQLKREPVPAELSGEFDEASLKGLRDDLVWIKIVLPPAFDENAMAYLRMQINCFPIANMYVRESASATTQFASILPIVKDNHEYFLFMDSVTDTMNREYRQVLPHGDDTSAGTYAIRRGGSERFDTKNATEYLERLRDLLRGHAAAFSAVNREIPKTVEALMVDLAEFERKLGEYENDVEQVSYLIPGENMKDTAGLTMRYFLTNGAMANHVRALEPMETPGSSDMVPGSIMLMTSTRGGSKSPSETTRRNIYQYLLTSRDQIYTRSDVKSFCKCFFGDYFEEVRVEHGYEAGYLPRQGIIKVIKVILKGVQKMSAAETETLRMDVLAGLERRSPDDFVYRVIVS